MNIRVAVPPDVLPMVELSEMKRTEYSTYSPVFWRKAEHAAEKQPLFFQAQLEQEQNIVPVYEENQQIEGFLIASLVGAPPVYNPGGPVCVVDDFVVSSPELWETAGQNLFRRHHRARESGAPYYRSWCVGIWTNPSGRCFANRAPLSHPSGTFVPLPDTSDSLNAV